MAASGVRDAPVPGAHLLRAANDEPADDGALRFSEATDLYLRLKGPGKAETFHRAATRACRYLAEVAGVKPLSHYVRTDAAKLRDRLVGSGLAGSSVSRLFTTVKSIFNFACMETGLELKNPFTGLYLDRERGVSARKPIPAPVIKRVRAECVRSDDPLRWAATRICDSASSEYAFPS